jgi:competence protein ComEC
MYLATFAFCLSIIFSQFLPNLIAPIYWITIIFGCAGLYYCWRSPILKILIGALCGLLWLSIYAGAILKHELPKELENQKIVITGYIASIPEVTPIFTKFAFKLDSLAGKKENFKIELFKYAQAKDCGYDNQISAGDHWQFLVKLKRPHGTLNPGSFDFEKHLFANKLRATGYIIAGNDFNKLLDSHWYYSPILRLRQNIGNVIAKALNGNAFAGILIAITNGSQSNISNQQWQVFRITGTEHLIAIAGLHIGFFAGFIYFFANLIWRKFPKLMLIKPAQDIAAITALISALVYSVIAGFALPTERSSLMLAISLLAMLSRQYVKPFTIILFTLTLILLINPLMPLTMGFWLSFTAVTSLIYSLNSARNNKLIHLFKMQLTLTCSLMPLGLLYFHQFSIISIIANILAIPIFGFLILPLTITGVFCNLIWHKLTIILLNIAAFALQLLWHILTPLSNMQTMIWQHSIVNLWLLIPTFIGIILLLTPFGTSSRLLGTLWLLPLCFYHPTKPLPNQVLFTTLDVGQGLATVIRTKNHTAVFDTGPKFSDNDAGAEIVVPFLEANGIRKIDTLIVSHADSDHSGGAKSILQMIPTEKLLTTAPELFSEFKPEECANSQKWQWDGINFQFLNPMKESTYLSKNNRSCVLLVRTGNNTILLPADIEAPAEELLVQNYPQLLHSTILIAPHHGSKTSSSDEFVNATHPQYVIFPTGYLNRFHFPSPNVVEKYNAIHSAELNTAYSGAITFKLDQNGVADVSEYRKKLHRYWRQN